VNPGVGNFQLPRLGKFGLPLTQIDPVRFPGRVAFCVAGPRNRRNQKPGLFGREMLQRHGAAAATPVDSWRFVPPRITFWLREAGVPIAETLRQHNISKRDSNAHSNIRHPPGIGG
jgi:hypothetical protein